LDNDHKEDYFGRDGIFFSIARMADFLFLADVEVVFSGHTDRTVVFGGSLTHWLNIFGIND